MNWEKAINNLYKMSLIKQMEYTTKNRKKRKSNWRKKEKNDQFIICLLQKNTQNYIITFTSYKINILIFIIFFLN